LKECVDFTPPRLQQFLLSQQRLCLVLESRWIAARDAIAARFRFDSSDTGDGLLQIGTGQRGEMCKQCALIPLLRRKQHRPLLQLNEDERLNGHRQTRERLVVTAFERRGVAGQPCIELRLELHHLQKASSGSARPSHSGNLNPRMRAMVGATSFVRMGRSVPVPAGTPAPTATSQTRRHESSPLR
jgi:hypothetical protein